MCVFRESALKYELSDWFRNSLKLKKESWGAGINRALIIRNFDTSFFKAGNSRLQQCLKTESEHLLREEAVHICDFPSLGKNYIRFSKERICKYIMAQLV